MWPQFYHVVEACPGLQDTSESTREKLRENLVHGAGIRHWSGACKHFFFSIPHFGIPALITLWLVNFYSFTSTLTLNMWLQTNAASVCNPPLPHISTFVRSGRTEVFKNVLTGSPHLLSRCFLLTRFFVTRPFSSLVCNDREPGTG